MYSLAGPCVRELHRRLLKRLLVRHLNSLTDLHIVFALPETLEALGIIFERYSDSFQSVVRIRISFENSIKKNSFSSNKEFAIKSRTESRDVIFNKLVMVELAKIRNYLVTLGFEATSKGGTYEFRSSRAGSHLKASATAETFVTT